MQGPSPDINEYGTDTGGKHWKPLQPHGTRVTRRHDTTNKCSDLVHMKILYVLPSKIDASMKEIRRGYLLLSLQASLRAPAFD